MESNDFAFIWRFMYMQVQLNLMAPRDNFYGNQQTIQGLVCRIEVDINCIVATSLLKYHMVTHFEIRVSYLQGQLNSIAPSHDGYYNAQQSMHGLVLHLLMLFSIFLPYSIQMITFLFMQAQMDFFRTPAGFSYGIRVS